MPDKSVPALLVNEVEGEPSGQELHLQYLRVIKQNPCLKEEVQELKNQLRPLPKKEKDCRCPVE